jgi:PAS domain S-box-containing protein
VLGLTRTARLPSQEELVTYRTFMCNRRLPGTHLKSKEPLYFPVDRVRGPLYFRPQEEPGAIPLPAERLMHHMKKSENQPKPDLNLLREPVAELEAEAARTRQKAGDVQTAFDERFRFVADHTSDVVFTVDLSMRTTYVSRSIEKILGYTPEERMRQRPEEQLTPESYRRAAESLAREISRAKEPAGEPNRSLTLELEFFHKNGSTKILETTVRALRDKEGNLVGALAVSRDVPDHRRAESVLRESETRYKTLIENQGEGIAIVDPDENFAYCNPVGEEIFGVPAGTLVGRNLREFTTRETFAHIRTETDGRRKGNRSTYEVEIIRPNGERRYLLLTVTPWFGSQGEFAGAFGIFRDETNRKRAQEERLEMERGLLHAQKLESLGLLAGGIAHDFNNLLMAVMGNLDLALMDLAEDSPARSRIERAIQATRRAADLTGQMLAYAGKGRFLVREMNLGEAVRQNLDMLKASISKHVRLNLDLGWDLPAITADPEQIQQVVVNLIANASEAIGDGPGVISLTVGVLDCDDSFLLRSRLEEKPPAGRFVFLEVSDTGCGMDQETQLRLFEPFFTTKFLGRGMGMPAVLGIVRGHKGAILVDCEPDRQTTVRVLFPVTGRAPTDRVDAAEAGAVPWADTEAPLPFGTVLVVDDETVVREVARAMLERIGCRVLTAGGGLEAVEVFRAHAGEISCVILDLTMPDMDGVATFGELRRVNPDAKVILSSGHNEQEATRRFAGKGLAGFIHKPYQIQSLRVILERILKQPE